MFNKRRMTPEDRIFEQIQANIAKYGSLENYSKVREAKRIADAYPIVVADFTIERIHKNIPYLTVTTQYSTKVEFGMFGTLDVASEDDLHVVARVYNRPFELKEAVVPSTYRFIFSSREMMDSFMNQYVTKR